MSLTAGTRIGHYEVTALIGVGGMGEVYRARDNKLNRDVALKVLPEAFALDADRLARFKREAQVLASLNHPNIAAIYGFEDSGRIHALVLELVEGETLAERIRRAALGSGLSALGRNPDAALVERSGQRLRPSAQSQEGTRGLPVDEALPIAHQMAEAIEAAHEHGVVHRDLKPSNVKITPDGVVKVLDFGLAKLTDDVGRVLPYGPAGSKEQDPAYILSQSPTITNPGMMTGVGVILGTAAYMAPEQAKGRPADKRADVWAFGCVLYEMLTGHAPFAGDDVSDTLANVLKREPDWRALPADVPAAIRALLKRCLEKDRRRRISDIAAALFAIDEAANLGVASAPTATVVRPSLMRRVAVPVAALALGAALTASIVYFRPAPPDAPEMRLQVVTPPPGSDTGSVSFAISPDGQSIVFRAATEQTAQLWLRTLDSETARPLAGTENADLPFWSPDGRSIGFFADQKLKRMDVAGGSVQTLADAPTPYGATWNPDGVILFSSANTAPLYRIPATGGQGTAEATRIGAGQIAHRFPHFLPDGRRFLFFATGTPDVQGVFVGSLDSMEATRLIDGGTAAVFVPPDWVLFGREESLYAQRVDLQELTAVGDPLLVADGVAQNLFTFANVALSASLSGLFAYRTLDDRCGCSGRADRRARLESSAGPLPFRASLPTAAQWP